MLQDAAWLDKVRELLFRVWSEQACRCPGDRADFLQRALQLEEDGADLRSLVASAVSELGCQFGFASPPENPPVVVWRAFPKFDREHCGRLASLLIEAQQAASTEAGI